MRFPEGACDEYDFAGSHFGNCHLLHLCYLLSAFRQPVSIQPDGLQAGKVWRIGRMAWHILTFLDILILQRITICSRLYKEDI